MEKLDSSWYFKIVQPHQKTVWWFLKMLNIRVTLWPSNSTQDEWKHFPHKKLYMNFHTTIIRNSQIVEIIPMSINLWMDKMWYIHTMEYYSAIQRNEVLIHVTVRMNLENIRLKKASHKKPHFMWSIYAKCSKQTNP